jgi:hypothetical protein
VFSRSVARLLLDFADETVARLVSGDYMPWDSGLGFWLNQRGVESYLPYKQYGEHGGLPNKEHAAAGLRPHHRADVLASALHFLPTYAQGSRVRYRAARVQAWTWGLLRLLTGRFLGWHDIRRSSEKGRLLRYSVGRLIETGRSWRGSTWRLEQLDPEGRQ